MALEESINEEWFKYLHTQAVTILRTNLCKGHNISDNINNMHAKVKVKNKIKILETITTTFEKM